jgi:hypothetical protein
MGPCGTGRNERRLQPVQKKLSERKKCCKKMIIKRREKLERRSGKGKRNNKAWFRTAARNF